MEYKECRDCHRVKPLSEFYKDKTKTGGYRHSCKECVLAKNLSYREKHREELRAQKRKKWAEHKEELKPRKNELQRLYHQRHKKEVNKKQREYRREHPEKIRYYQERRKPQRRLYIRQYCSKKRSEDELFSFKERTRARVGGYLRKRGFSKHTKTEDILGEKFDIVWARLLKTWKDRYGEEWNGQQYHVDHIVPLATAKTEEDVLALFHYSNLQMLTPEDNLKKGGHYESV